MRRSLLGWGPLLPLVALSVGGLVRGEETSDAIERVEPIVVIDRFSGTTVRDREFGMGMIQLRGKKVPKVGELAPDFELKSADGQQSIKLSSFRGQQSVVLIFGSHT